MNKYSKYVNKEALENERQKNNKTYKDMSELMKMKSPASYFNIENGIVEPKISQMLKISKIFKKPVSKFFNLNIQEN